MFPPALAFFFGFRSFSGTGSEFAIGPFLAAPVDLDFMEISNCGFEEVTKTFTNTVSGWSLGTL